MDRITNGRRSIDPCKQHTSFNVEVLMCAMGLLPRCIQDTNPASFLTQVVSVCAVLNPNQYKVVMEVDKDGTFEVTTPLSNVVIGANTKHSVYAIGVIDREVDGKYQAIYFYATGMVIVVDKDDKYLFNMEG